MYKIFVIFFSICFINANSQQKNIIDSLILLSQSEALHDTLKIHAFNELSWELRKTDFGKAKYYALNAYTISKKINYPKGIVTSLNRLGTAYIFNKQFSLAEKEYLKVLRLEKQSGNKYGIARANNQLSEIYRNKKDLSKALSYGLDALNIFEQLKKQSLEALVSNNVGLIYQNMGSYEKANKYLLKGLTIREQLKEEKNIANNISNQNEVNDFLEFLIAEKITTGNSLPPYKETIYSLLYRKIDNYSDAIKMIPELFGDKALSKDNKTRFVNAILGLWTESKYNPYKNQVNGQPDFSLIDNSTYTYDNTYKHSVIIDYKSNKKFGIYNDDFTFVFDAWGRGIQTLTDKNYQISTLVEFNHLYQPVTLVQYPSETDTAIQLPYKDGEFNGAIPLFYLKYVDDFGDEKDLNTKIGYFIDVVTTVSGFGNLAKLRHLRHLSRLGQVFVIIETVQISAGIINFILTFVDACNDSTFCKKLKTVLTFIEITSLVTDPIAVAKTKKAAQAVVEEGIQNGWPSGMLDNVDGTTPKQKIQELADIDIADYINDYVNRCKKKLKDEFNSDLDDFDPNRYSISQKNELISTAAGKGLSLDDAVGIIHQASRKSHSTVSIDVLKNRMDNLVQRRKLGYPFPCSSKLQFEDFINNTIKSNVLDGFDLPKNDLYYGGSCITSPTSSSGDVFQDIDFFSYVEKQEDYLAFLHKLDAKYKSWIGKTINQNGKTKIFQKNSYESLSDSMYKDFLKKGYIDNVYIRKIDERNNIVILRDIVRKSKKEGPIAFDITIKIKQKRFVKPSIKINL